MRRILQPCIALGAVLALTTLLNAQSNNVTRTGNDASVTTGIGSNSTFKNVPPPPGQPAPDMSRSAFWYMPGAYEKPQEDRAANEDKQPDKAAAPPPPAAEAPENPRTMITRDRIESPQH